MTTNWRQRVLESHRADLDEWLEHEDTTELDEDTVDTAQRIQWLSSVRRWHPTARHREELTIRLTGGEAGRGGLRFSVGNALLKPLQDGVTASTDEDVELELVGISAGSTVLHVRPTTSNTAPQKPATDNHSAGSDDAPEAAEQAISVLFDAVKTVEGREDVTEWTPMLSSLSRLVSALDRFDLAVQFRYYSGDGTVNSSALTETGKQYVRELRKTHKDALTRVQSTIFGRVTEMKLSGVAVIKPPSSPAISVKFDPGEITQVPWKLGDEVHLVVEERRRLARGGGNTVTDYLFLGMPTEDDVIEVFDDPDDFPVTVRHRVAPPNEDRDAQ
ncbi:hypothetical protein [Streptomyces marincola]|uniref:hypothetical protein n=1 Tax=Streptomyces marincola TaxID=2878388 RepID=UPI001CF101CB|nr:hypothetical protein [Streptomyces marincola]UCM90499.1 hypothetical protein LC193_22595 [Streptomyces marincola]